MNFSYRFPAVKGIQAGREYYISMVPLKLLSRLFPAEEEIVLPEHRAQRRINEARIPEIKNYILDNRDTYVFSALSASIDGEFKFTPYMDTDAGIFEVDMGSIFLINDGQHRKAAIEAAYEEGQSKLKGNGKTVPALSVLKTPLRDGDLERPDDPAYANAYFINANSASAPGIVDADRQPILERSEVYSGVYGRASINLYAFNSNGNKGIACGLNNLQKIRDGEPLGGKSRAEDDFDTEEDDDFLS